MREYLPLYYNDKRYVISEVIPNIRLIAGGARHACLSESIHASKNELLQDVGSWISQKIKGTLICIHGEVAGYTGFTFGHVNGARAYITSHYISQACITTTTSSYQTEQPIIFEIVSLFKFIWMLVDIPILINPLCAL